MSATAHSAIVAYRPHLPVRSNRVANGIPVAWTVAPFTGPIYRMTVEPGLTVAEIVARAFGLPVDFAENGIACVNGQAVPRHLWHRVRVRSKKRHQAGRGRLGEGTHVFVTLQPVLAAGGSGGGSAQIGTLLASIALLAIGIAISGGALAGLVPGLFQAGSISAKIAGAVVGIGGALAIAALTPPPQAPALPGVSTAKTPSLGSASIGGSVVAPNDPLPYVCGAQRIALPIVSGPYVYVSGDDQFAECVYAVAGPAALDDIRDQGIPIGDLADTDYEAIDGLPGAAQVTLITRQTQQSQPNVAVSRHQVSADDGNVLLDQAHPVNSLPIWHPLASRKGPDEIVVGVVFPEALVNIQSPTVKMDVALRTRLRRRGDSAWVNLPEIHFEFDAARQLYRHLSFKFEQKPLTVPAAPTANGPVRAYKLVPGQTAVAPITGGWQADDYFSAGAGGDLYSAATFDTHKVRGVSLVADGVEFHLDPAVFPPDFYDLQLMFGAAFVGTSFIAASYVYIDRVRDLFGYWIDGATVRPPATRAEVRDDISIATLASIWNEPPLASTEGLGVLGVRVKNRAVQEMTAVVSTLVPDWDGAAWSGRAASSNPATHYRDRLARLLPPALIGDAALIDWRQACIDNDYQVSTVLMGDSLMDALTRIATAGYARPRACEQWDVLRDYDRSAEAPDQIFSPRNSANYNFTAALPDLPRGLRVTYADRDIDWQQDFAIVLDPEAGNQAAPLEAIDNGSMDRRDDVIARALFDLKQARRRFVFHNFDVPAIGLRCRPGDLIGLKHDALHAFAGFAFVIAVAKSGGLITGLTLDAALPLPSEAAWQNAAAAWSDYAAAWAAPRFGIAIALKGGGLITAEIDVGALGGAQRASEIAFVTPFADPGTLTAYGDTVDKLGDGCRVTSGLMGEEYERLILASAAPKGGMEWTLTCVDEAPELWS